MRERLRRCSCEKLVRPRSPSLRCGDISLTIGSLDVRAVVIIGTTRMPYSRRQLAVLVELKMLRTQLHYCPSILAALGIIIIGVAFQSGTAFGDRPTDWSRFHGPAGLGYSAGVLPDVWTERDYAWVASLNGMEVGSPVISKSVVYLLETAPVAVEAKQNAIGKDAKRTIDLVAFDLESGSELWRRKHPLVDRHRHNRNTPASTTPVVEVNEVDGDRVYFAYGDAEGVFVHAYATDSAPVWSRDLGPWTGIHGFGTSPMVVQDKLILFNEQQAKKLSAEQSPGQSRVIALDTETGEEVWSTPVETTRPSYGVPALHSIQSSDPTPDEDSEQSSFEVIFANTGNGLFSLDVDTGQMRWSIDVFDKRSCSSPLIVAGLPDGDLAIGSCGSGGGGNVLSAVRIPKTSDDSPEEVFRVTRSAPYVPTSAVKGNLLFAVSDSGIATCYDLSGGGRNCWSQRLGGNFGASPIIVGDNVLMISLDGIAHMTAASPTKSKVNHVDLAGRVGATPAFSDGRLILRVGDELRCLVPVVAKSGQHAESK